MPTPPSQTPEVRYESEELEHEHQFDEFEDRSHTPADATVVLSPQGSTPITRTLAIIKPHALAHRFDIERRIQEASFEIVKERQMEFDTETDPDTLYELFGEDTDALAEGPVWVYVLERRRAVEVWNTLMGNPDVEVAKHESPNSLRALYGLSHQQNGLMGSPDVQTAEIQIASLFASSPPFPTSELPADDSDGRYDTSRSVDSAILESIRKELTIDDEGYAASSVTNPSTAGHGPRLTSNGNPVFKARALPATHDKPDIVPRMTKAAQLRLGKPVEKAQPAAPRAPVSKERQAQTFANVPGHKRASTITVASTAAPTIAPRMTRAASLRLGQPLPPPVVRQRSAVSEGGQTKAGQKSTFEGVPGHKRRESIAVASSRAPTVAPRLNKSAALRQQKDQAPPTSFMFRSGTAAKTPSLSRTPSKQEISSPPKAPPTLRPASQASGHATPSRYAVGPRASSVASRPIASTSKAPKPSTNGHTPAPAKASGSAEATNTKPKPRPSSVIGAPSIQPRTNKSAALRAAKKEAENAAAAAAAAKKAGPRPSTARVPPSSFKPIPV